MNPTYIRKNKPQVKHTLVHLSSLFENATEGIIVTNGKGEIIMANPSAGRMFGYMPDELINQKVEMLIPNKSKAAHVKLRDGFSHDPQNRVMGHNRDLLAQTKDGGTFPVEVSLSTYVQEGERYVTAFIIDITRRKEVERNMILQQQQLEKVTDDMRKLNAELEAKVEERTIILREALMRLEESQNELSVALDKEKQLSEIKSRFVSMASHEFRTPLSTVLSSAALLEKYSSSEDQDKRSKHIVKIKNSVKHLNSLLEDFLSLGKLDEGKVATHLQEFGIEDLIRDTIEEMSPSLKAGQKCIYKERSETFITSDKNLIRNILFNLLSNAIKFSEEYGMIRVYSKVDGEYLQVNVEDEGIGISEEDMEHLFSTFFRGKNVTNIEGTGLGLHIVKRYVDLLDGSVHLESELGKGTKIKFTIPVKK